MDIPVWLRSLGLGKSEATFRVHFLGRSHLSLALERAGRFTPLSDLISALAKAEREGTMREKIRFFCRFSLPHFLREFENARTHCQRRRDRAQWERANAASAQKAELAA